MIILYVPIILAASVQEKCEKCLSEGKVWTDDKCESNCLDGKYCLKEKCPDIPPGEYFCPWTEKNLKTDCVACIDPKSGTSWSIINVDKNWCSERTVFHEFVVNDVIGLFLWFIGAGLAISAGVGGGAIFVPLSMFVLRFDTKAAAGVSQASIFGSSLAGFVLNVRNRHPTENRPLINYEMLLFSSPMELAGTLCGVLVQRALPTWLTLLLMFIIVLITAVMTLRKGLELRRKDKAANKEKKKLEGVVADDIPLEVDQEVAGQGERPSALEPVENEVPVLQDPSDHDIQTDQKITGVKPNWVLGKLYGPEQWKDRESYTLKTDSKFLPFFWGINLLFLFFRGSKRMDSIVKVPQCGVGYWMIYLASVLWPLSFALTFMYRAVTRVIRKQIVNYQFIDGDIQWTWKNVLFYGGITMAVGFTCGLIGISSGNLLGPFFLILNLPPLISTAVTGTMSLLTGSIVSIGYVVSGQVPWSYALTYFIVSFFGGLFGKKTIDSFVKRRGLSSLLVLILAGILFFATAAAIALCLLRLNKLEWQPDGPVNPCPKEEL